MKHEVKMWLRNLSHKNDLFQSIYGKASSIRTASRKHLSDEEFLKQKFKESMGKTLNLENPQTFNEKLQWLKLHDRNPLYTTMVDKYAVRDYVADRIGSKHLVPLYGVWDKFSEINFTSLPNQFVLKCTHDCGSVFICQDKETFDFRSCEKSITSALKRNYYYVGREWPYKNAKPRIIAEKFMVDESGYELKDYKFFCFKGVAKALYIATDRNNPDIGTKFDFYDMEFNYMPFTNAYPNANKIINRPDGFLEMKRIVERLSKGIPHVRVDLYNINGEIYTGEMTFYHMGGMMPFVPEEWDYIFGQWIELSPLIDK